MAVTLAVAALILVAVFVGVAIVGGLLFVAWQRRQAEHQIADQPESFLERDEHRRRGST